MEQLVLLAEKRELLGKGVKRLRRQGLIPGVLYGRHTEPLPLSIPKRQLEETVARAGGTRLITLQLDDATRTVLVRGLQRDTLSRAIIHVDLYEVTMTEKITAMVPVVLVGASPAVERGMGVLVQGLDTVEIECLPSDLIAEVKLDISSLKEVHDTITVADLQLGPRITILSDPEEMLVAVAPIREEEEAAVEEAAPAAATAAAPAAGPAGGPKQQAPSAGGAGGAKPQAGAAPKQPSAEKG